MRKLYFLDAFALIYRAHFAFMKTPRITTTGLNTSAIFGFTNTVWDLIQREKPTHLGVAFDTASPTFRHENFADYKAHRQEVPEDIIFAVPWIKKILEALHIPILEIDGFEADDIIGTLALKAGESDYQVFMVTPDKDYAQLVRSNVFMYRPAIGKNPIEILGEKEVVERYGVPPHLIADWLGLMGDSVDNIPGVPKIGEKTALELVQMFGSLEEIIANAEKITKKAVKESLIQHADQGRFSKELATIHTNVPIAFEPEKLHIDPPNEKELLAIFKELEFKTLAQRIVGKSYESAQLNLFDTPVQHITENQSLKTIKTVPHQYSIAQTSEEITQLIDELSKQVSFCFDTETTSLDPNAAQLVAMTFSWKAFESKMILFTENQELAKEILFQFKSIFENENIEKYGQNMKYDLLMLKNYGLEVKGKMFDTMLAHYVVDGDGKHNMDILSQQYLKYSPISIEELIGKKGKNQKNMREVPLAQLKEYACEDADITFQLVEPLKAEVTKYQVDTLFSEIEMPLMPVLTDMEFQGICIDTQALTDFSAQLSQEMLDIEQKVYELAGETFNLHSPKQLGDILFVKLGLKSGKKTATGQFSTNEETLAELAEQHEIVSLILDYRELSKLKSTYVDALPELINPKTKRVHTTYSQAVAVTGRLSSNNPNLQNIPIRTDRGKEVRKAFVACDDEHVLISADYSQIELRIMAALSQDNSMIEAFKNGEDIHVSTASKIFKVPQNEVNSDMRRKAKTANFGIIYGISAFGLAQRLKIPRKEAKYIIDSYFEQFPKVKNFMDLCVNKAREDGFVATLNGRKRFLRDIHSKNWTVRGFAERTAINTPIQGTAADIIKMAMISVFKILNDSQLQTKMLLQVHDELLFEAPKHEIERVIPLIKQAMENAFVMIVPLEVNVGIGKNWLDAH